MRYRLNSAFSCHFPFTRHLLRQLLAALLDHADQLGPVLVVGVHEFKQFQVVGFEELDNPAGIGRGVAQQFQDAAPAEQAAFKQLTLHQFHVTVAQLVPVGGVTRTDDQLQLREEFFG